MSDETDRWGEDRGAPLTRPAKRRLPGVVLVAAMLLLGAVIVFPAARSLYGVFNPGPRYAKVVGRVTYRGTPLPSGAISFVGPEGAEPGTAEINEDGTYVVRAPVGDIRVTIKVTPPEIQQSSNGSRSDYSRGSLARAREPIAISAKYADPAKSGLRFTVKKDANQIDIDLTE